MEPPPMRTRLRAAAGIAAAFVFAPVAASAEGGPFRVDNVGVEEAGTIKLESFGAFSVNPSREREVSVRPGFVPTALPFVEFSLGLTRSAEACDPDDGRRPFWATRLEPEAKVELFPVERFGIGLGVKTGAAWRLSAQRAGAGADADPDAPGVRRPETLFAAGIATVRPVEPLALNLDLVVGRHLSDDRARWLVGGFAARF
jgi:hypothetical protein